MQKYIQKGEALDWLNTTGSTVASGAAVLIGKRVGFTQGVIVNNAMGVVRVEGVYQCDKTAALAIAAGDPVYYNISTKKITKTATDLPIGFATAAAAGSAAYVNVKLHYATAGAVLADATGGTPATTVASIAAGGSYAQADMVAVKNGMASILAALQSAGIILPLP